MAIHRERDSLEKSKSKSKSNSIQSEGIIQLKGILKNSASKENHIKIKGLNFGGKNTPSKEESEVKSGHHTPKHKSKKLIVKVNRNPGLSPMLAKTQSAMLPKKNLNIRAFPRMRRLSTIGQAHFNKSIANTYEFKDLKELAKSNNDFTSSYDKDKDDILNGRSLYIFSKKNKIRKFVSKIIKHPAFDFFIIFVILVS